MAYRNLDGDHKDLVKSIRAFEKNRVRLDDYTIGTILLALGDYQQIPSLVGFWDASAKPYHQSEAFKTYSNAAGLHDYWREYGFPPQCRPVGEDDFDCD